MALLPPPHYDKGLLYFYREKTPSCFFPRQFAAN